LENESVKSCASNIETRILKYRLHENKSRLNMDRSWLPSWFTPELGISILILVFTIILVYLAYRELRPGLRVRVKRCFHKVRYAGPRRTGTDIAGTELVVDLEIGNTGGTTTIHEIEIRCKPMKLAYHTTESVQSRSIVIERGKEKKYLHQFFIPKREITESPLKCTFFLHHTHGKKKVKAKSALKEATA